MIDMPPLCILLLTYDRLEYAKKALRAVLDHVEYSGQVSVHIADDGSPEHNRSELYELAGGYSKVQGVSVTNSARGGYGANYNLALQTVHITAKIILPLEDDWELLRPLNLDELVLALQEGDFGCIRLGYIGYTQELRGIFHFLNGHQWLRLDPDSGEPHIWAGHPRLETREWQREVGPWPEGLEPGSTEFAVAQRRQAREGVVWPLSLVKPAGDLFVHFGTEQAKFEPQEAVEVA